MFEFFPLVFFFLNNILRRFIKKPFIGKFTANTRNITFKFFYLFINACFFTRKINFFPKQNVHFHSTGQTLNRLRRSHFSGFSYFYFALRELFNIARIFLNEPLIRITRGYKMYFKNNRMIYIPKGSNIANGGNNLYHFFHMLYRRFIFKFFIRVRPRGHHYPFIFIFFRAEHFLPYVFGYKRHERMQKFKNSFKHLH